MTQAWMSVERVLTRLDTKSRKASPRVRALLAFGIVAAGYLVIAAAALHGIGAGGVA
jgi:uncharacterized membrane protein YidH (DUF202 family)